ncbi:MAG: hypothetical protein Q7U98_01360 [Methylicorpusculum sp.]|uniref:hypothetical protein n=1 Tax=Methylicorpusculum sp. TaxID=2713644 RepID=UPI002728ED3A|nr:hypothetical protein [Methylicorpusculum sp.]MDO8843868.1 hypothetical protein [Methylicorpusculum sp.]MDO8937786.1 hypothetical protein [Methylicorpusculum sp.]MDO9239546.1 hypothetical protein [Methylicorpusculum sp.]MDP2180590.1 hypothetical protein [Methylicorpusculum sp.]MDP2201933.1 hypothetical protein [Methylicorpusculum sp.]
MQIKAIMITSLLLASSSAMAGLFDNAAKQLATDAAKSAAPEAVNKTSQATEALDKAKTLQDSIGSTPEALKEQAAEQTKDAAQQKVEQLTPAEAKEGLKTLESGAGQAEELKSQVESLPKSTDAATEAVKEKSKTKALEKTFDLIR